MNALSGLPTIKEQMKMQNSPMILSPSYKPPISPSQSRKLQICLVCNFLFGESQIVSANRQSSSYQRIWSVVQGSASTLNQLCFETVPNILSIFCSDSTLNSLRYVLTSPLRQLNSISQNPTLSRTILFSSYSFEKYVFSGYHQQSFFIYSLSICLAYQEGQPSTPVSQKSALMVMAISDSNLSLQLKGSSKQYALAKLAFRSNFVFVITVCSQYKLQSVSLHI